MPTIAEEAWETSSGVWCHWAGTTAGMVGGVANGEGEGEGRLEITVILQTTGPASTEQSAPTVRYLDWSGVLSST